MIKSIALRFLRGFIAGGVANLAAVFTATQFNVSSLTDLRNLGFTLGVAFIAGGILALDKLLRSADAQPGS